MEKILRNSPTYAVIIALVIQVNRVSDFGFRIGAEYLAVVYALFLALTIYALSYWVGRLHYEVTATLEEKARYAQQKRMERLINRARFNAQLWLTLFILIDGGLNLAETMSALPNDVLFWEYAGAAVYGVFPTLSALGLGSLQAHIDKIPAGASKAGFTSKLADKLLARLDASDKQGSGLVDKPNKQGDDLVDKLNKQGDDLVDKVNKQDDDLVDKPNKQALTDADLLAYWQANPQASDAQVGKHFKRTSQAIQQRRRKLIERGAFITSVQEKVQS